MDIKNFNQEQQWLFKEKYRGVESSAFHADCARLALGEPLGYVIGQVPFLDCVIYLDSKPLIPRPETEYWVEQAIATIQRTTHALIAESLGRERREHGSSALRILDLCAGSGAIGVAVAKAVPKAQVTFAEIDPAHLLTIEKNININLEKPSIQMEGLTEDTTTDLSVNRKVLDRRFALIKSDLFESVTGVFDFILTNPPYIDKVAGTVAESVTAYEPPLALFGGYKGMEVIMRILKEARAKLAPATANNPTGGQLWIEHEPFQVKAIAKLAKTNGYKIITHQDQYQVPRYSVLNVA